MGCHILTNQLQTAKEAKSLSYSGMVTQKGHAVQNIIILSILENILYTY